MLGRTAAWALLLPPTTEIDLNSAITILTTVCFARRSSQGGDMKSKSSTALILAALLAAWSGTAWTGDRKPSLDIGKSEYLNSCAVCHGSDGKGGGTINDLLKVPATDLTKLSKRNGGVFPVDRVYAVIDGREIVKGHGDRDMPAWGSRYSIDSEMAAEYYRDVPYDMDMYTRARIMALIDYLNRIQQK
jgi:mono/diheme cytochrome c family protein